MKQNITIAIAFLAFIFSSQANADDCSSKIDKICLSRQGASAIPAQTNCSHQMTQYMRCLQELINSPEAQIGKDGPVEIGTLIISLADQYHKNQFVEIVDIVDLLGETISWNKDSIHGTIEGKFDAFFLGVLDRSTSGINKNVWRILINRPDYNAHNHRATSVIIDRFFINVNWETAKDSIKESGRKLIENECPGYEYYGSSYNVRTWVIEGALGSIIRVSISMGSGGVSPEFWIGRYNKQVNYCKVDFDYKEGR